MKLNPLIAIGRTKDTISVALVKQDDISPELATRFLDTITEVIRNEMMFNPDIRIRFCSPEDVGPVIPLTPEEVALREQWSMVANKIGEEIKQLGDPA